MKATTILALVILVISVHNATGQMRRLRERMERQRELGPPSTLKVVGISSIVVGGVSALYGSFDYLMTGDTGGRGSNNSNSGNGPDPLGLAMMVGGGGLVVAGVCLLIIDHNHNGVHRRVTIIASKRNEVGLAYNF